jgi:hypothetical protein
MKERRDLRDLEKELEDEVTPLDALPKRKSVWQLKRIADTEGEGDPHEQTNGMTTNEPDACFEPQPDIIEPVHDSSEVHPEQKLIPENASDTSPSETPPLSKSPPKAFLSWKRRHRRSRSEQIPAMGNASDTPPSETPPFSESPPSMPDKKPKYCPRFASITVELLHRKRAEEELKRSISTPEGFTHVRKRSSLFPPDPLDFLVTHPRPVKLTNGLQVQSQGPTVCSVTFCMGFSFSLPLVVLLKVLALVCFTWF